MKGFIVYVCFVIVGSLCLSAVTVFVTTILLAFLIAGALSFFQYLAPETYLWLINIYKDLLYI